MHHILKLSMRTNFVILLQIGVFSFISQAINAQSQNLKDKIRPDAYAYVEKMPQFPGGTKAMYDYLASAIGADSSLIMDTSGYVIVQFYVEKDGTLTSPKALRSPDQVLSDAAVKYISTMPKWKPAMINDTAVACVFTLSVKFGTIILQGKTEK